tara:strand:- start:3529 stop:4203 length:675 start_codon:yes stop_codon:yes gene_type:complete
MVRSNKGGRNNRKIGRKFVCDSSISSKTRESEDPSEEYAIVKKILGNGHCSVLCLNGKERICVIRKKFRGRSKRDNNVCCNSWILVGIREYEKADTAKCDLITVYNEKDKNYLKSLDKDWSPFLSVSKDFNNINENVDIGIEFVDDDLEPSSNDLEIKPCILGLESSNLSEKFVVDMTISEMKKIISMASLNCEGMHSLEELKPIALKAQQLLYKDSFIDFDDL